MTELNWGDAGAPHCDPTVIHARGTCYYCDHFPELQMERAESGKPFSKLDGNGWAGNKAVKAGERHTYMGVTYVVGENVPKCTRIFRRGWKCIRDEHHTGPCGLVPKWWNVVDRFRYRKYL